MWFPDASQRLAWNLNKGYSARERQSDKTKQKGEMERYSAFITYGKAGYLVEMQVSFQVVNCKGKGGRQDTNVSDSLNTKSFCEETLVKCRK